MRLSRSRERLTAHSANINLRRGGDSDQVPALPQIPAELPTDDLVIAASI